MRLLENLAGREPAVPGRAFRRACDSEGIRLRKVGTEKASQVLQRRFAAVRESTAYEVAASFIKSAVSGLMWFSLFLFRE